MDTSSHRLLAQAMRAFLEGEEDATVHVHSDVAPVDVLPAAFFFRPVGTSRGDPLWSLERKALELCRGHVLDAGAGTGVHSLHLQSRGMAVTALELLGEGVELLRERGVRRVRRGALGRLGAQERYDTILLLMNGWGLAGTLGGLDSLLAHLPRLLAPGGQILADSTDLREDTRQVWGPGEDAPGGYPGEVQLQVEFRGRRGAPFPHLFVDPNTLARFGEARGWRVEIVGTIPAGGYLSRLTPQIASMS